MGEKLAIVEHKGLAGKTLNVPPEVHETGKLIMDANGQTTLPLKAAAFLSTIPEFKIIKKFENPDAPLIPPIVNATISNDKTNKITGQDSIETENLDGPTIVPVPINEGTMTVGSLDEQTDAAALYPDGDPNLKWTKPQLTEWLSKVAKIEFDTADKKEVLLGKAFKYLEENKNN